MVVIIQGDELFYGGYETLPVGLLSVLSSEGHSAWNQGKREESKARGWLPGYWDIPYVPEQEAIEHAAQLADRCIESICGR